MMNINSSTSNVLQQGLAGMENSSRAMVDSANELVRSGTLERPPATTDMVASLVNIYQQQHLFDASASVVNVAGDALGALIDIKT